MQQKQKELYFYSNLGVPPKKQVLREWEKELTNKSNCLVPLRLIEKNSVPKLHQVLAVQLPEQKVKAGLGFVVSKENDLHETW